ncbi:MAG: hypothetical protein JO297_01810 [Nitrososphaeraceae archaeon]|nr:hypothetical protein [Nitrososphaeraceae archaeon]
MVKRYIKVTLVATSGVFQKSLKQILLYILLLLPLSFIAYPLLLKPGSIMSGDFPYTDTYSNAFKTIKWTWIQGGIFSAFEILARYPMIGLFHILSLLNISSDIITKLMIILGFFTASISFYFTSILFLKDKIKIIDTKLNAAAVLGSLFYAYNIWSFGRFPQWYLWIAYAIFPLFFISVFYSLKKDHGVWKYIVAAVLTWTIASSAAQMIVFFGLTFIAMTSLFILVNFNKKRTLIRLGKPVLLIVSLYLLINTYWIYPYILSSRIKDVAPARVQTEEVIKMLSRNSNFLNVFRLTEQWFSRTVNDQPSQASVLFPLWLGASFLIPVLAFSSLLKKNRRYVLYFSLIAVIGIFLTVGTESTIKFWTIFVFYVPFISKFNYLFREPDKWAFLIAFAYSFLISITSFEILKFSEKVKHTYILLGGFLVLALGSILLSSYPIYNDSLNKAYGPTVIPDDFKDLNKYLSNTRDIYKFFLMPYAGGQSNAWSKGHLIGDIVYQLSLVKPSIMPPTWYYTLITNSITLNKTNNINNLIYPLGTSYLIYHNDTLNPDNRNLLKKLYLLKGIKNIHNSGFFKIFRADWESRQLNIPSQNIVIVGDMDKFLSLNSLNSFNSLNTSLFFLDSNTGREKYDYAMNADGLILDRNSTNDLMLSFVENKYIVRPFDIATHHYPSKMWSVAATTDPLHGDFHPYLNQFGIENRNLDYGNGLVLTWARNNVLNIPVEIEKDDNYNLYMRYLENQQGGVVNIYLDNKLIKEVTTKDQSNKFSWENIGTFNMIKGKHTLTLENVQGFNAVNIFALIPPTEKSRLESNMYSLSNKLRNIYLLEAESSFSTRDINNSNFSRANDISQKYGNEASSGKVLTLYPHSEVFTKLDILKPSNYTIALRVKTCETCTFLRINIGEKNTDIPLKSKGSQLRWLYLTTYLQHGGNELRIYSDSETDLDSVILYSTNKKQTLEEIFNPKVSRPAQILEYKEVNPTKFIVKVNATSPHMLAFAEPYDPLWIAYIDKNNFKANSIPLYSIINGFYINRTGEYTLYIEYQPQKWFFEGLVITIVTITALVAYIIWHGRRSIIIFFKILKRSSLTSMQWRR